MANTSNNKFSVPDKEAAKWLRLRVMDGKMTEDEFHDLFFHVLDADAFLEFARNQSDEVKEEIEEKGLIEANT